MLRAFRRKGEDRLEVAHRAPAAAHGWAMVRPQPAAGARCEQPELVEHLDHRRARPPGTPRRRSSRRRRSPRTARRRRSTPPLPPSSRDRASPPSSAVSSRVSATDEVGLRAHRAGRAGDLPAGVGRIGHRQGAHTSSPAPDSGSPCTGIPQPSTPRTGSAPASARTSGRTRRWCGCDARAIGLQRPPRAHARQQHPGVVAAAILEHRRRRAHPGRGVGIRRPPRRVAQRTLVEIAAPQQPAHRTDVDGLAVVRRAHRRDLGGRQRIVDRHRARPPLGSASCTSARTRRDRGRRPRPAVDRSHRRRRRRRGARTRRHRSGRPWRAGPTPSAAA